MYWLLVAGFSGVCACENKSKGAETNSTRAKNRRVIFMRERILTLTVGVAGAQRTFALVRAQDKTTPSINLEAALLLFFFLLFLQNGRGGDGVVFFQA